MGKQVTTVSEHGRYDQTAEFLRSHPKARYPKRQGGRLFESGPGQIPFTRTGHSLRFDEEELSRILDSRSFCPEAVNPAVEVSIAGYDIIDEGRKLFSEYYGREITAEDALDIFKSITGIARELLEINKPREGENG